MPLSPGTFEFECFPMSLATSILGINGDPIVVALDLSASEVQSIIDMLHWAWETDWFREEDHILSECKYSELFQERYPELYEKVYFLVHSKFCSMYPYNKDVDCWGVYNIFPPDDIFDMAVDMYSEVYGKYPGQK